MEAGAAFFSRSGPISFTVDEILAPFQASANHVGAIALPYFSVFGASFQASDEEINQSAKDYVNYILK
jgi:putative NADPH-quinone reductase